MANSIETVWKLILDEKEVRQGEGMIERLSRLVKTKLGGDASKAIDKTTEALERQNKQLKENEEQAKRSGSALETTGKVGGAAGKLRGVGSMLGGGEGLGLLNDVGDAAEGVGELVSTLGSLGPAGIAAAAAVVIMTAVIGDFAKAAQEQAAEIDRIFNAQREVFDEIASGATSDDLREQIELLQFRRELEKITLQDATEAYASYEQQIRDTFGVFGEIILGIARIIDPREDALNKAKTDSETAMKQSEEKERQYTSAIEQGLTAKADAAKAEEDLQKSRDDAAKEAEKQAKEQEQKAKEAQRAQQQAAAEQERIAEQARQKQEQAAQKRLETERKYTDALVDIANAAADDAVAALTSLKQAQADNQRSFLEDIGDLSSDFQASEHEEAIARQEEEAADLRAHALKLTQIRDDAFAEEEDLLRNRDFLGATRVRENANRQIEQENKALQTAADERNRVRAQEDAQQLRELDKARRDRFTQLQRANAEAKLQYQRDIENQREARRIAEREARDARSRDLRDANETARQLLGIHQQTNAAQLQMAQGLLANLRGMSGTTNNTTTNNNQRGNFGTLNMPVYGANGNVRQQVLGVLAQVGLTD